MLFECIHALDQIPDHLLRVFLFGILISAPLSASAAVGDNCQTSLTADTPDSQDWKEVYIVRGDDGSAWQRGIISNPIDALLIKEGKATNITATVGANTETAFFLYAADDAVDGAIRKPGEGVCFEGPQGDAAGSASFPVNARTVWGSLDKKLVVDVFYRMDESWDQLYGQKTNNNFLVGTSMLPRVVDVKLYVPPSSGSNGSGNPLSNGTKTVSGKWESDRSGSPTSACGQQLSKGFECKKATILSMGNGVAYTLDPANIDPSLLGNNFDGVGGYPVQVGLFAEGFHTFYARPDPGTGNPGVPVSELTKLTFQSTFLEVIKRLLEGKDMVETVKTTDKNRCPRTARGQRKIVCF